MAKKVVNSVADCVDESISGWLCLHPGLRRVRHSPRVIVRGDIEEYLDSGRVTIVVGGGSGHEPLFYGYIGSGMATCAVHGNLFASPGPEAVLAAIRAAGRGKNAGVLLLINNYTGDRLNFGIAAERAHAEGIEVEHVVVADDCATPADKSAGKRGLAGCVLVWKIAGALAEAGLPLAGIVEKLGIVTRGLVTLGACLSSCSLPGGQPLFNVADDAIEIGLGLHGEAGVRTEKLMPARITVRMMVDFMADENNSPPFIITPGMVLVVLINNLGSTTDLEINIIVKETVDYLIEQGAVVKRAYAGRYCTSQEMAGFSISLLHLSGPFMLDALDSPTTASNWLSPFLPSDFNGKISANEIDLNVAAPFATPTTEDENINLLNPEIAIILKQVIHAVCKELVNSENHLNELDLRSGDGDCGTTLAYGAKALAKSLASLPSSSASTLLAGVTDILESNMGGCSGALYSLMLTAVYSELQGKACNFATWLKALEEAIVSIESYGGARRGDRTMLDALYPAYEALQNTREDDEEEVLRRAVQAAKEGAESTTNMAARAGRASYVHRDHLTKPDPGAVAIAICLSAIYEELKICKVI